MSEINTYPIDHTGASLKIGVVRARFSAAFGDLLLAAALQELQNLGVKKRNITLLTVPGALEIPAAMQQLLRHEQFDAIIAVGVVIRGETYHFELVSNTMAQGIAEVSLTAAVPVANAVLTVNTENEALARVNVKGREAAQVAVEMANHFRALSTGKK